MKPRILRVWYSHRLDTQSCPEPQQAELLKLWRTGAFNYWGIQCKAMILANGRRITLSSEGQWGIRSDHPVTIEHVEQMEAQQLEAALSQQGLGKRAIAHAFRKIERVKIEK